MWKKYQKTAEQEMRPYIPGEDTTGWSISEKDTLEFGGMVARDDVGSQWYVSKDFFKKNYAPVSKIEKSNGDIFVEHIQSHLRVDQAVFCKICNRPINLIVDMERNPQNYNCHTKATYKVE